MQQKILTPSDETSGIYVPTGPLSPVELQLGKVIDLAALLPGDLILVSALEPGFIGRAIRRVQQRGGFPSEHAQWEHAALYVGEGVIVEATRKRVRRAMLSKFAAAHRIRARRDPKLTIEQRYQLVIHALTLKDTPYHFLDILKLYKKAKFGFSDVTNEGLSRLGPQYPKSATICSQLYADCYVNVTGRVLGNLKDGISTPAALSSTGTLMDIALQWLSIDTEPTPDSRVTRRPRRAALAAAAFLVVPIGLGAALYYLLR